MSIVPNAVPHVPKRMYQARTLLRSVEATNEEMVDSSIALKGPISLPLVQSQSRMRHVDKFDVPGTDHAQHAGGYQDPIVAAGCKDYSACSHEQ